MLKDPNFTMILCVIPVFICLHTRSSLKEGSCTFVRPNPKLWFVLGKVHCDNVIMHRVIISLNALIPLQSTHIDISIA